jgi:tetratricopeptide (TPR) repeat protein
MRAFVFTDKSLTRHAGRFVWLEIDTETAENAGVRKRLGIVALPTFFIVDPASERVALRWVGGATLPQLEKLLDDGALAVATARPSEARPAVKSAESALARADRLYGEADYAAAAAAFEEALSLAPAGWPRYGRTVESLLFALDRTEGGERGALLAHDAFPRLRHTSSAANVAASGLDLALGLAADHPARGGLVNALEQDCREVAADATIPVAADDRSAVYGSLLQARKDAKDEAGAKQVATQWIAFLDGEATRAERPDQRVVFDAHRVAACLELGTPERAIPMLEASERDFPDDYNPPARLAAIYRAMKKWDEALAASNRAIGLAYGPRKLSILQTRADIFLGRADSTSARRTLEEAVALAESLPPGQRSESTIAALKRKLAALP